MEILQFQLSGRLAHFRKYYANNTAFSYFLPPRTTLKGVIAAAMGKEKDSYYEAFASEHIRLGVGVRTHLKKSFHRLNLLMIKGGSDFRGRLGRVQTPFEIVSGQDIRKDEVCYAVYVAPTTSGEATFEEIKQVFLEKQFQYSISLGIAGMVGKISDIRLIAEREYRQWVVDGEDINLHTAVSTESVHRLNWDKNKKMHIEEELHPADFVENGDRELRRMVRVLYTTDGSPLPVRYSGEYYQLNNLHSEPENITFLDMS
ncbi:MAG: CRISPR-associated protein Cas5 [Bacteroidia bacterium]